MERRHVSSYEMKSIKLDGVSPWFTLAAFTRKHSVPSSLEGDAAIDCVAADYAR